MKTSCTGSESETPAVTLHRRAEGIAREKAESMPEDLEALSPKGMRQALHELRVHQIELEMQNEELRRAQAKLDAARARYFDLYDLAPVGYCTLSEQRLILDANLTAAALLGVARGALVKQPISRFILKEDQDIYYRHCKQLVETHLASSWQTGEPQACELRMVKSDGTAFWAHLAATAAQDADGEPVRRVVLNNITERKRAEEALRKSERRYREFFATSRDCVFITSMEGKWIDFNDAALEMFGYDSREELSQVPISSLYVNPEERSVLTTLIEKQSYVKEHPVLLRRRDGAVIDTLITAGFRRDADGSEREYYGTIRDITDRKRAEEELRKSEEKYRNILENIEEGYFEVDLAGNFTFFNPSLCRILGYPREEMPGMNNRVFMDAENAKEAFRAFNEVYVTGIPTKGFEWETIRKDGARTYLEVSVSLIAMPGEKPTRFRGIARDITERKKAETELQQTLESLRKAIGATIQVMVSAVETRDPYTAGHQIRTTNLALFIAMEMGLPQEKIDGIRMAGSIHDIGKLSIPVEILSKPTALSEIEFSLIKEHSITGYKILKDVDSPWPLAEIVLQHHERMDGSGYPQGLKGEEILMEARIIAVADVVESMASHRPYRAALGLNVALEEIEKNRGTLYDEAVVDACLRLFREKGYRFAER